MKVKVSHDACIGCGACVSICPEVFSFNDDGYAKAIINEVDNDDLNKVIEAIESCPTEAISKSEGNN